MAGLLAGGWVFSRVALARGPLLSWDEGGYVWKAHFTAQGMRDGDASMVWRAAGADRLNPPLHSVLLGTVFLLFGDSERTVYGFTTVCFAACALLLWMIAWDVSGVVAAAIAVLCLLGSRLHLEYTATAMLEVPGTALTLLAAWLYLRHLRFASVSSAWWAGFGLLLVFFYKYNFGLFLIAAVLFNELWRRPLRPYAAVTRGLWIPLAVAVVAWFAIPGKVQGFFDFAGNRESGLGWLDSLFYYPKTLGHEYAAWIPSGVLIVAGALLALSMRRRPEVRFLFLFAAIGLGGMTLHRYKLERSIATVTPTLWILAGIGWAEVWRLRERKAWITAAAALGAAAVWIAPLPQLHGRDLPAIARHLETGAPHPWSRFPWPGRDLLPARDLILGGVNPAVPVYIAGEFRELPPMTLQWWFARRHPRTPVISQCFASGAQPRPPLNLVTIEVLPTSPYFGDDYRIFNAWALEPIHDFERSGPRPAMDTLLAHAGVKVRVYRIGGQ